MYLKANQETLIRNNYEPHLGLIATIDGYIFRQLSTSGKWWSRDIWDLSGYGYSCLNELLDVYGMEVCSQKEALEFLEDCKKRLYPMDHCGHSS